jgi:BASS family bile acid:Na+ symporter
MEPGLLVTLGLPLAIAFIMVGMGLGLTPLDFKRLILDPRATLLGLSIQMVILPVVGFMLIRLLGLTGGLAVGMMILAACPGGPTSNLITLLARGDMALSITLTAISSCLILVTIPLIVNVSIRYFGEEGEVLLPLGQTVLQIFAITILPVSAGMWIRYKRPALAIWADVPVRRLSGLFFVAILLAAILKEWEGVRLAFLQIGPAALGLNIGMMIIGYLAASFFALPIKQRITLSIDTGIQNGSMGIFVAATLLQNSTMALPSAIYGITMFLTAAVVISLGNRAHNQ